MTADSNPTNYLSEIKWNSDGLVAAIAQDIGSGRVLMQAWMNAEALQLTLQEGRAIYWSRSRQKIWRKGEESGHVQKIHDVRLDCDGDALLLSVEQIGEIACHTGRQSCFYKSFKDGNWQIIDPVLKEPDTLYKK